MSFLQLANLFSKKPKLECWEVGYSKVLIYRIDQSYQTFAFDKLIRSFFYLLLDSRYQLFVFADEEQLYEELGQYMELENEYMVNYIVIISKK